MNSQDSAFIYGKLPPQNMELEAAVLGAILLESDCLYLVSEIITTPEMFYKAEHQTIFEAIQDTVKAGNKVDLFTVADQLKKSDQLENIGGAYKLTMLTVAIVSSANVISHAKSIQHYWQCREIIRLSGEAMQAAYEPDADPSLVGEGLTRSISGVLDTANGDQTIHAGIVADGCVERVELAMNNPGTMTGVNTGLKDLNKLTNGWQKHSVNILAARPSQGKTALALILACNSDKPVLIFSLEMSREELVNRMLSSLSGVPLEAIQRGTTTIPQLQQVSSARVILRQKKIYIDDKAGLTTMNFQARLRKWKRKAGIGLAIVDYLQLMQVTDRKGKSRESEVSEISRTLKLGAKENDIALIALSQMNREIEKVKRRPHLADLRESGAIEQDADIVLFIWHEEDPNEGRVRNKLVVAKNRNGKTDDIELRFVGATQQWTDMEQETGYQQFNPYAGMTPKYFEPEPF